MAVRQLTPISLQGQEGAQQAFILWEMPPLSHQHAHTHADVNLAGLFSLLSSSSSHVYCPDVCTVHLPEKFSAPSRHFIAWLIGEIFFLHSGLSRSIAVHGCFIFKGHNRALWTIVLFFYFLQTPYGNKTEYVPGEGRCGVWNLPGKNLS